MQAKRIMRLLLMLLRGKTNASKLFIRPPQPAADRHGLAAVLIAKDERHRIDEWLDFHRQAGVRHFFIYDNLSTDGTADYLKNNYPPDLLTLIPWHMDAAEGTIGLGLHRQALAYSHALCTFGSKFRWMMFIDIDEFVFPKKTATLPQALEPLEKFSNISLPWVMFGFSGHDRPPPGGVVRNYLSRAADPFIDGKTIIKFKCILDPCQVTRVGVHQFATRDMGADTVNDQGTRRHNKLRRTRGFVSCENIQLNHYYTKSRQELEERLARGGVCGADGAAYRQMIMPLVEQIERSTVEDLAAANFYRMRNQTDTA
ncbi:MAG: glycosyltransferase family 92 protein [Cellvibrionales bacterium]|nr:glycosyltransferase family 92 protein [Cellvibrionales bacterium]